MLGRSLSIMIDLYLFDCFIGTSLVQKVETVQCLENKQSITPLCTQKLSKTSFAVTHSISNQHGARQSCISPMSRFLLDMLDIVNDMLYIVNVSVYGNILVHTILLKLGNRPHWGRRTVCCIEDGMSRDFELALSERWRYLGRKGSSIWLIRGQVS